MPLSLCPIPLRFRRFRAIPAIFPAHPFVSISSKIVPASTARHVPGQSSSLQGVTVKPIRIILASLFCFSLCAFAQTADELVAKNIQARGGLEKIKAIQSLRMTGSFDASGFKAVVGSESKRPNLLRQTFAVQSMTQVQAYDGASAWQISPFG